MKLRTVLLLLGVFLLLGLVALVTDRAEQKRLTAPAGAKLLPKLDTSKAAKMQITVKGVTDKLERKDTSWRLLLDQDLPADSDAVSKALERLEGLTRSELASENPAKHEALEVKDDQDSAVQVQVWSKGGPEPVVDLLIGKTGSDFQSNYVRVKGENQVYRSAELLRSVFDRGSRGWGDMSVLKFEPDQAVKVELEPFDGGKVTLERASAKDPWRMTAPAPGPADQTLAEQIVGTLSTLQADDFAGLYDAYTTGLDHPARSIVTLKDGQVLEADWGKEAPKNEIYVEKKGGEIAYVIASARMTAVFPELAKLRGPEPAAASGSDAPGAPTALGAPTAPATAQPMAAPDSPAVPSPASR